MGNNNEEKTMNSDNSRFDPSKEEERILEFWEKNRIFEKSLEKTKNGQPFTFYDGPPFATGLPHYGHILASTIKDVIPRYQTMKGRFVRRRWGWDCHGLPIEEVVERHLGISGKKEIEKIGIGKFNAICREKVLEFVDEWGKMVRRIARWIDFDNSYKTMDRDYMESVWWAFKKIYEKGLVYEGRKVLMYCPRCETPVSNFEVAMDNSYQDVTEDSVIVKFNLKSQISNLKIKESTYFLAWTTTPWTLPGNVALAVGKDIDYVMVSLGSEKYILAEALAEKIFQKRNFNVLEKFKGEKLIGLEYEPLFEISAVKSEKTFKVYPGDFVSTEEGTGIVHTAVVYGEEDYELGQKFGLPVEPLLDEKGEFNDKAPKFLQNVYFKDADAKIIADLEKRGSIFQKEKITHSYPYCWRCNAPLFYNAIPAWFINIQKIKKELIDSNNREINWFPEHLKHGRYEKSVEQAPDWNISRNRYWGNPIPVWKCEQGCPPIVIGSIKELGLSTNTFYFVRHAEGRQNVLGINSSWPEKEVYDLTEAGVMRAKKLAERLKETGGVDLIFSSDLLRTKHTAEIIGEILKTPVQLDERLREYNIGVYNGKSVAELQSAFPSKTRWTKAPKGGETWTQVQKRMVDFIKETDKKYQNKKILVVGHGDPLWLVQKYYGSELEYPKFAEPFKIEVGIDDLHRPSIDEIVLKCPQCGGQARRVKEIFDSWLEAGSMPFAEYHYPFDQKEIFESRLPAQFVAEYIAQTRAWFYVMHVVSLILFGKAPFENVVTTGTILAEDGSKMSKSKGNFPDPWEVIQKYGVDALRFYLMNSTVMKADNLNFSVRDLEIIYRRVVMILWNVGKYFDIYAREAKWQRAKREKQGAPNTLDKWILARTKELVAGVTGNLDRYDTVQATRLIAEYIDDLSTWYVRRSRGRKDSDFFNTLYESLLKTSQMIAPVMPYLSEILYLNLTRNFGAAEYAESVHLSDWPFDATQDEPKTEKLDKEEKILLEKMAVIREAASLGMAIRKTKNIPVRQPLPALYFSLKESGNRLMTFEPELTQLLLDELNIKKFDPLIAGEKNENIIMLEGTGKIANFYLNVSVSEDLYLEGLVRALERGIQELRKKQGLKVGELAELLWNTDDEQIKKALGLINKEKTYLRSFKQDTSVAEILEVDGKKVFLSIVKK